MEPQHQVLAPSATQCEIHPSGILPVLEEYLNELEAGRAPDPDGLIARHPEMAEELRSYLQQVNALHQATMALHGASVDPSLPRTDVPEPAQIGDFTLVLLHYDRPGNPPYRPRVMNEPGLTHLSITVDDLDATLGRVVAAGGEVLQDTNLGVAVLVRDPDGQLVELLANRPS